MTEYDIARWDAVMFKNSLTQVPMIYIKPDIELLEYLRVNKYVVAVQISDSDSVYDGKVIPCVVDSSCTIPSCRPNFCEATGYYVASLWSNWYGYPKNLGKAKFIGLVKQEKELEKPDNTNYDNKKVTHHQLSSIKPKNMSNTQIFAVFGGLLVLILAVLMISLYTRR